MVGAINSSTAQQLYTSMQAPAMNSQNSKPVKAASEEVTESGSEKKLEMSKGEIIDTYA